MCGGDLVVHPNNTQRPLNVQHARIDNRVGRRSHKHRTKGTSRKGGSHSHRVRHRMRSSRARGPLPSSSDTFGILSVRISSCAAAATGSILSVTTASTVPFPST